MAFVSVTRLHLASRWTLPAFVIYTLRSQRQASRSNGFMTGWIGTDPEWGFWTVTVWTSAEAMLAFRNRGIHMKAMTKLRRWCDEAAFVHWEQPESTAPDPSAAYERLAHEGRMSKVDAPSARHQRGERTGVTKPRPGQTLRAS